MPDDKHRLEVLEAKFDQLLGALGVGAVAKAPGKVRKGKEATLEIPPPPMKTKTLSERVEEALHTEGPITTEDLARDLGEPADRVKAALTGFKDKVCNVGVDARPRWIWRPGEDAPTKELRAIVIRLLQDQPMTTRDIYAALGTASDVAESRVQGVMVEIRRHVPDGYKLVNLGTHKYRREFLLREDAPTVSLPKKQRRK